VFYEQKHSTISIYVNLFLCLEFLLHNLNRPAILYKILIDRRVVYSTRAYRLIRRLAVTTTELSAGCSLTHHGESVSLR